MNHITPLHRCYITPAGIAIGCAYQHPLPHADTDALAIQEALLDAQAEADERFYRLLEWGAYAFTFFAALTASAFYPDAWF